MFALELQIVSDLHLETPKFRRSYNQYDIPRKCPHLALLGDIGNVEHQELFDFLIRQLRRFNIVFYVMGNHEPYGSKLLDARAKLIAFEANVENHRKSSSDKTGQFIFLNQRRFDLSEDITILGCTLFSNVSQEQHDSVKQFISDFVEISEWSVESHVEAHEEELNWLNAQVSACAAKAPHRSIVILTHHSPTTLEEANAQRHQSDPNNVQSAYVTDLSKQICWTTPQVKIWAFGHTHFNCDIRDRHTHKRIIANQKGYFQRGSMASHRGGSEDKSLLFDAEKVVKLKVTTNVERNKSSTSRNGGAGKRRRRKRPQRKACILL